MATIGESSSSPPKRTTNDKPVIVRVKRKTYQSRLDAFWLEINERPSKRPLLDFEKLSINDSVDAKAEEWKAKKVFVQHVETVVTSETTFDVVQSFVSNSADVVEGKSKIEERKRSFKKDNKQEQLLSKAMHRQEVLAKKARFEQIWRKRRENKESLHDKAMHDMCHFYDVIRVDAKERSNEEQQQELTSLEDQKILRGYLPLLREFIPSAAEELESDVFGDMSKEDDYVYDYYAVNGDMNIDYDSASSPFPLVQVDDEDFYDGLDNESEYDSDDSNAEAHPWNDYPDESSEVEDEAESEASINESKDDDVDDDEIEIVNIGDPRHGLSEDANLSYEYQEEEEEEEEEEDDDDDEIDIVNIGDPRHGLSEDANLYDDDDDDDDIDIVNIGDPRHGLSEDANLYDDDDEIDIVNIGDPRHGLSEDANLSYEYQASDDCFGEDGIYDSYSDDRDDCDYYDSGGEDWRSYW